eukprot:1696038-Prymnesium_polylepis.1
MLLERSGSSCGNFVSRLNGPDVDVPSNGDRTFAAEEAALAVEGLNMLLKIERLRWLPLPHWFQFVHVLALPASSPSC